MTGTTERLLSDARALAATARGSAAEVEAARNVSSPLIAELKALGIFRMGVSERFGGLELDIPSTLPIIEILSAGDGSVGWAGMIGAHAPIAAARLPLETLERIYADGPDVIWANSMTPAGMAEEVEGGYRVSGRWPFASICQHADWMFANCIVTKDGKPKPGPMEGVPLILAMAMPAAAWRIEDSWFVSGLRGTGSHHIALEDVFVPAGQAMNVFAGRSQLDGAIFRAPMVALATTFAAVAVGIAEGALNDVVEVAAPGKKRMGSHDDLRDSAVFQHELGGADAAWQGARALLHLEADRLWGLAQADTLSYAVGASGANALAWVGKTCAEVVDVCYRLAGASAVYDTSPLQRRLRDVHAVTQHKTMNLEAYTEAGAAMVGHPAFNPLIP